MEEESEGGKGGKKGNVEWERGGGRGRKGEKR